MVKVFVRLLSLPTLIYSICQGLKPIEHQKNMVCKIKKVAGMWTSEALAHANSLGCHTFNKPFTFDEIKKWLDKIINYKKCQNI